MTGEGRPVLSVIVCTRERPARLRRTLETLAGAHPPEVEWELLVVDNGSGDDTARVVRELKGRLPLRTAREQRTGLSHARNRGAGAARGETLIWIDDDVEVPPGWLRAWWHGVRAHPGADFYGADIGVRFEEPPPPWIEAGWTRLGSLFAERVAPGAGAPVTRDYLPYGANFAIRADAQTRHPYDPALGRSGAGVMGGEETAVLEALLAAGAEGRWVAGAGLTHVIGPERVTPARIRRQLRANARLPDPTPDGRATPGRVWLTRRWLLAEFRWRLLRPFAAPERWVDDFIAAAVWRGKLDGPVLRAARVPPPD